ncbi:hypothetical protein Y1Q_0013978 [Alligator mississippiensis]|nr:hypothetical protein Y1Q_0013978 [Alligator mississippiensis]
MIWTTFLDLLELVDLLVEWQDTTMQQPLPTDTKLAITLLKPAMPASPHYVSHFGMGKAATGEAILEV